MILENIQKALAILGTKEVALKDFTTTFQNLGCGDKSQLIAKKVLSMISATENLDSFEKDIKVLWKKNHFNGKTIFQLIDESLKERSSLIVSQIEPFLKVNGKVLDYGCGDGRIANFLHNSFGYPVEGVDIRNFLDSDVIAMKFSLLSEDGIIPVENGEYEVTYATNVLHHEKNNEGILKEITRVTRKKLIIIETVPEAQTQIEANQDWGRVFMNDFLWNRCFNFGDIPVPGTYDIPKNWIKRFEAYGWHCTYNEDLGFDQPTIQDRHWLFVFER